MYTNTDLEVIQDTAPYIELDGTKYPRNFPKSEIEGLFAVTETPKPSGDFIVTGFIIDETHTQVWQTRSKTQEELDREQLVARQQALVSEWSDAFSLLDDILVNGIDNVKLRRDAVKAAHPKPV